MSLEYSTSIPHAIVAEHDALHAELERATRLPGRLGEMAATVARVLQAHFEKEEQLALAPLGLLSMLIEGRVPADAQACVKRSDRFRAELPRMLEEHREIAKALDRMIDVALAENRFEIADFGERLKHHASMEEEVLYPAAILVGEFIRARGKKGPQ
ncbi:MAG: hemerythrin domain-containing protein [Acidobacteria bacterium]|nr:hemerythrin domain-containing protein [Acidobacteriota bacterium]